jgi:hypothetical protein
MTLTIKRKLVSFNPRSNMMRVKTSHDGVAIEWRVPDIKPIVESFDVAALVGKNVMLTIDS